MRKLIRISPDWQRFSVHRAARTSIAAGWLVNNVVSATLPAPSTHYDLVKFICDSAARPIPVATICEELRNIPIIRVRSLLGIAGDLLDQVAINHRDLEWWVTDKGLHMEAVPSATAITELLEFDRVAGALVVGRWEDSPQKRNTNLSAEALHEIAIELDPGFKLLDALQPKQKAELLKYNELMATKGIKTFAQAAKNPRFSRMLRRRLYVARERYLGAASKLQERPPQPIPVTFSSYPPII